MNIMYFWGHPFLRCFSVCTGKAFTCAKRMLFELCALSVSCAYYLGSRP